MGDIFSNAYLTIAASAAENGQQGLLNRREIQKFNKKHEGTDYTVCIRVGIEHEMRANVRPFPFETISTLRRRAWCLQEELLSSRVVHFTKDEIIFVCREGTICECSPTWFAQFEFLPPVGSTRKSLSKRWSDVVEHYSTRQISLRKDRLPALSSLSHFFGKKSDNYLAGLWQSDMPMSLLWSTTGGRPAQSLDTPYSEPPSWSWASIEGIVCDPLHIRPHAMDTREVAKVIEGHTYPSTKDPRGMVSGGHIIIRAPILRLVGVWFGPDTFTCRPGFDSGDQWMKASPCRGLLDDKGEASLLPSGVAVTPIFLLVICTSEIFLYNGKLLPPNEYLELKGLLVQSPMHLTGTQRTAMWTSGIELACVRIGVGSIVTRRKISEEILAESVHSTAIVF